MKKKKILVILIFFIFNTNFVFSKSKKNLKNKNTLLNKETILDKETINNIIINGNERIDNTIILNKLNIQLNTEFKKDEINDLLKKLYETEYFKEITMDYKENNLIINVVENPLIIDVLFDGNDKISDEILLSEIRTMKRGILNKNKITSDTKRILDIYRRSGRFLATVTPKIIEEPKNRVKVVFEIKENKPAKIRNIYIIGNNVFNQNELKDIIQSKESKILRFSSDEVYDPLRIEYDKELLKRFYYSKGYPNFEILSATAEIDKNYKWFDITFLIDEGEKYKFGKVELTNNIEKVDTKKLEKKIKVKENKIFNAELLNDTVLSITNELAKEGFMFTDITPSTNKNDKEKKIDVNFIINETPRYYVGKIKIIGNTRTYDNIIRQELRLEEGDPFNLTLYNRSIQKIRNLGFFDKVDSQQIKGEEPNILDIVIEVREKKTGEFQIGVGYSTTDGVNANVGIKESNLFGTGQSASVNFLVGEYTKSASFSYGKPYLFGRDLYSGIIFFYRKDEDQDSVEYEEEVIGGGVDASYSITEYLDQKLFYEYEKEEITEVDYNYQGIIELGKDKVSILGETLYYDRVDNRYDPSKGFDLSWTIQYAGVGGTKKYIKNTASTNIYIPIIPYYLTFKFNVNGGVINPIRKETLKVTDGFYIGSSTLKGFKYGGVGPRTYSYYTGTPKEGNSVGGKKYYVYDFELKFPLGLPKEYGIYGSLFYNAGNVTGVDKKYKNNVVDSNSIRSAYGLSILWQSPMGPLSFDFSRPVKYEYYDERQNFSFNFGGSF